VEFAAKEVAAKRFMAKERRSARELEEKAAYNTGYPALQAYWRQHREEAEAATTTKRAAGRRLGKRRRANLPNRGSSSISAMAHRLAAVQAIRAQQAGRWSPSLLARVVLFLPKKERNSTIAARVNSGTRNIIKN
jgi:hypothetical protein